MATTYGTPRSYAPTGSGVALTPAQMAMVQRAMVTATLPQGYTSLLSPDIVPRATQLATNTSPGVTTKSEGDTTQTDNAGGNTGGGGGGNTSSTTPPVNTDTYGFTSAIGNMINRNQGQYQDPAYTLPYGNYGPQFPNLGTQIGSAMYTNVQPKQYTPNWMIDRLPQRLGMQVNGQLDPNSPYITGRKMGNYGQLFQKFGAAPQGPFGITPGGGGQQGPFGGGAYQNLTQPFNPYPLNGYDPTTSLNVHSAPNPYLANQQGGTAYGGLGGLLMQQNAARAAAPPPPGPTNTTMGVGGGQNPQPGTTPGPGGYETQPGADGVVHLLSLIQQNPQLRGLLGF